MSIFIINYTSLVSDTDGSLESMWSIILRENIYRHFSYTTLLFTEYLLYEILGEPCTVEELKRKLNLLKQFEKI